MPRKRERPGIVRSVTTFRHVRQGADEVIIVVNVDPSTLVNDRATDEETKVALATVARGFINGVVLQDRLLLRAKRVPPIYSAFMNGQIRFRNEPWAGRYEEFADALTCMRRGWADCDDCVPWRVAELQEKGVRAGIKIYWRENGFHVEVRMPDGSVEDVAGYLGMNRQGFWNHRRKIA